MFWFTFNLPYTSDLNWHWRLKFYQTRCTRYLGIAVTTHFSSSSLVLRGLELHSVICFAKLRVCSERTTVTSVVEYSKTVTAQQLGDRIMHIILIFFRITYISRLKYNSWIEKTYSNDNLNFFVGEVISKTRASCFIRFPNARKMFLAFGNPMKHSHSFLKYYLKHFGFFSWPNLSKWRVPSFLSFSPILWSS